MLKIGIVIILIAAFIFFRGAKKIIDKKDIDCRWQYIWIVCSTSDKKAVTDFPPWAEVFKEGVNFK
jgi:hypothetical protein